MKRIIIKIFHLIEETETIIHRILNKAKKVWNKRSTLDSFENRQLLTLPRKMQVYRIKYNEQLKRYKGIKLLERVEKFVQTGIDYVLFVLVIMLVLFLFARQIYNLQLVQNAINTLHAPSIGLGCFAVGFKIMQIRKLYYEFKLGYGERILSSYINKYWNNT